MIVQNRMAMIEQAYIIYYRSYSQVCIDFIENVQNVQTVQDVELDFPEMYIDIYNRFAIIEFLGNDYNG